MFICRIPASQHGPSCLRAHVHDLGCRWVWHPELNPKLLLGLSLVVLFTKKLPARPLAFWSSSLVKRRWPFGLRWRTKTRVKGRERLAGRPVSFFERTVNRYFHASFWSDSHRGRASNLLAGLHALITMDSYDGPEPLLCCERERVR